MPHLTGIINTTLLERYVLDRLDANERSRLECRLENCPQLSGEVRRIEQVLESYLLKASFDCEPCPSILERTLAHIKLPRTSDTGDGAVHTL